MALFSPGSGALDSAAAMASFLLSFSLLSLILLSVGLGTTGAAAVVAGDVSAAVVLPRVPAGCVEAFAAFATAGAAVELVAEAVGELAAESGVVDGV